MQNEKFDQFIEQLEQVFDQAVHDGDDDELFASGYLRGHFDLVVAQLELHDRAEPAAVLPSLKAALDETKHELSPADQQHIANMVTKLETAAS
ncbi:YfcL family protein [Pseudidiomarina terrestris]|uniref:YfcL family protein n=1 Tax=Pseudidiomarina terrestris TaxID=2820060 RepID=A0AAW7QZ33_9GAMM|nr:MULTISPECIES: YfcL family protein [unclassified Pseudidiomarina]MDN7124692.1 YfcL family protein [Pseudidiomarina sp. 1APP75-32.1]MDN7126760.1 YfcL family protein [Pseudidiomarina sp. 1APR75-33.1]MDN7129017.1 YfcL family protein [Pseudidiomarina sp. 1APR75-15]MDN7134720.1 YfcL family protein [Pseudidiomarina sp. 1ASP75-5]MEA3587493.1 YfcL family protein [Pseudidiomarina sp. 1APP75-27a]